MHHGLVVGVMQLCRYPTGATFLSLDKPISNGTGGVVGRGVYVQGNVALLNIMAVRVRAVARRVRWGFCFV